ncbi:glycine oxidase [Pseudonocardia thermophila]|jgi:glycine oxidase ThiO|uniref:glycine oxidase n=1 Tax=Pseudonocardia thermophila TaxID=1848 RepID=A0A1M6RUK8_PSETH|nr:glycine oxidase ThiO [Pseudonocardia thermophila]SHK36163.1 glycine oxidase [Pseudonocardia thermophila]
MELSVRVMVVGAGVIGLTCAWRVAAEGFDVTLVDPAPASGSSWVAGGMLAPVTEAWPGEETLLELGLSAVAVWPSFAEELTAAADRPAGLRTEGTVVAATGTGDRAELDALAEHLARLGRTVQRLSGRELRRLEPGLGPAVRGGLSVPGDLAVDNRALLNALQHAARRAGVTFVGATVRGVLDDGTRVTGVRTDQGELRAEQVLVCAGAHSAGLHPALAGLIRPVKGEIVRLGHRTGALPPPARTVRALVDGRPVYLVPRDGGLVVGATQYEAGFDTEVTVAGVRDLLRDAERILPGIAEYALLETAAGLRPGSPDNLPLIGPIGPEGLLVATGHHRNGILLAPVTAAAVLEVLRGGSVPAPTDPRRFRRSECT